MLHQLPNLKQDYKTRTYIISSGDNFSAAKAVEFEKDNTNYDILTVTRARRVHQSILTTPYTALLCLRDCLSIPPPDLIITNGPGTGVCVILASILKMFFGIGDTRTIFIESWARVKTLSLSAKLLKPFVDRMLVQWPDLAPDGDRLEYVGPLVK